MMNYYKILLKPSGPCRHLPVFMVQNAVLAVKCAVSVLRLYVIQIRHPIKSAGRDIDDVGRNIDFQNLCLQPFQRIFLNAGTRLMDREH